MEDKKTILEKVQDFFAANEIDAKVEENEPKKETFETVLLVDGVTEVTVEPAVEVGAAIVLSSEDGTPVAAPVGEYELQDGRVIVVAEEGVVAEIKDASMEEEEELATDEPNQPDKVKRLIESIVTEKQFVTAEAFNKVSTELETEKKTVKFLQENHEELTTLFNELKQFTKETFETLLAEPSKEPVQKKKNPLKELNGESVNIFTKLKS